MCVGELRCGEVEGGTADLDFAKEKKRRGDGIV